MDRVEPAHSLTTPPADAQAPGLTRLDLRALYFCGIACLLGLLHPWTIPVVGALPVGELVMIAMLAGMVLSMVLTSRVPVPPSPRGLVFFTLIQLISLLSYVFTDLYRGSLPVDMARGWLRIFFLALDIIGFALLFGADRRIFAWHQLGYSFSFIQVAFVRPIFGDYWKFGFGFPLTTLVVLVAPLFAGRIGAIAALGVIGVAHAALSFRSLGAACWLVAGLLMLRYLPLRIRQGLVLAGMAALFLASPLLVKQTFTSESGRSNRSNVERGAMLQASWEAFVESPLIGQGSWFSKSNLLNNFLLIRREAAEETHNAVAFDHTDAEGVTIHSQLLVTLAEAGIFGAAFFIVYAFGLLWTIWYLLGSAEWTWMLPSRLLFVVLAFWDVLMTPFSGPIRLNIALAAAVILMCWQERKEALQQAAASSP